MAGRTIVVGDLHGCFDEACELLEKAKVTAEDRVIFTGDLVDRGPKQRECVELAMKHSSVLGNHEEKHLRLRKQGDSNPCPALEAHHYEYLAKLPKFIRLPEFKAAVVHAGARPHIGLDYQDSYHLLHIQCFGPMDRKSYWPSKAPKGMKFWTQQWKGPERLIFGHTVVDQPLVSEYAVGIDTGCVYGRALTAVILPGWTFVSVPAHRQYKGGKNEIARIPIHGDVCCFS